jgi:hypothetical protein
MKSRMIQGRAKTITKQRIDKTGLVNTFFANQFSILNPEQLYNIVKGLTISDETSTNIGNGCTEFPANGPRTQFFRNILRLYEDYDNIAISRIVVQETGISQGGLRMQDYANLEDSSLRIVINLRPQQTDKNAQTVGIHLNIQGTEVSFTSRQSFATVLAGALKSISLFSGNTIPGTRFTNARSLFIIYDVQPLGSTMANVADRICARNPIDTKTMAKGFEKALAAFSPTASTPAADPEPTADSAPTATSAPTADDTCNADTSNAVTKTDETEE